MLLGAGPGLATSGLLYLGSYLRRHGVEAYARPLDTAPSLPELTRRLHALLERTRPRVVGVSLKWFLHLYRGLHIANAVKAFDPSIAVVFGGDTASHYYRELLEFDCVDFVVRGDGEAPLTSVALGKPHPNVWSRGRSPSSLRSVEGLYLQKRDADDSFLSDLDALFLCESDRYYVPPFVVGGKGCSQGCLYCGGARTAQDENFARRKSFMRPYEHVRRDIAELARRAYCLVYDFSDHPLSDPTAELERLWSELDFSRSGILYYAWRVPPLPFVELLASRFESVTLGLDFGCFSERQRRALIAAHRLKPLPDDSAYLEVLEACSRHDNVRVRVSAVAGLPLLEPSDLEAESALVERLLAYDAVEDVLFDRVHAQPGAPLLASLAQYGMRSPVRSFQDFLAWSEEHAPNGEYDPPLLQHELVPGEMAKNPSRHRAFVDAHSRIKERIAEVMRGRARRLPFEHLAAPGASRRLVRHRRSRVLNRYDPRTWWLPEERPDLPPNVLAEEHARVIVGHVWDDEFGAVSLPGTVVDYVLPAFDEATTPGDALAAIRARGGALDERTYVDILRFLWEKGILREAL